MKLPIAGPAYEHSSIDVNNQRCVNMFITGAGPNGRGTDFSDSTKVALVPTAGLELLLNQANNPVRCLGVVDGFLYMVLGTSVYKVTVNTLSLSATAALIGSIDTTSGTVYMAANPTQIIWVDGSNTGYLYTPGSSTFETLTSGSNGFPGGGQVKFIGSYFVVNDPGTGQIYFSDQNDGSTWDPLSVMTAESGTDDVVGLGVSKGELWILGTDTIEIAYNAGNDTGSPFSFRKGLEIQGGCGAPDSIASLDDLLIWLDDRGYIVQSALSPFYRDNNSGYILQIISTEALATEILSYERRDDAIAMTYNDRGHLMYQITFPTVQKTWVYDYTTKSWHERSYYNVSRSVDEHHLGQFSCEFSTLTIFGGIRDGKLYIQKPNYYDDNGDIIRRIRVLPPLVDLEGYKQLCIYSLEVRVETGRATQSSLGSDPYISMRYSNDGGHTWSNFIDRSLGQVGEYGKPIVWSRLGTAREWVFEFTISEPIAFSIIDAIINVEAEE